MGARETFEAIVRAWERGDIEDAMARFADDAVLIEPGGAHHGAAAIRAYTADNFTSFTDVRIETTNFLECGDRYALEWVGRMTHSGPLKAPDGSEIPATGRTIELVACEIGRFEADKLVESRVYYDSMAMAAQLGILPS